jgi:putative tryptophan/tyrosine transport system substrate-binding protein
MLKEIEPCLAHVILIGNRKITAWDYYLRAATAPAQSLGIEVVPSYVENAGEIERAIASAAQAPHSGLMVPPDSTAFAHRDLIVTLAARYELPVVYPVHAFVSSGGLMSYATDQNDMFRLAASYVDRILRDDKPSDLPVQVPTRYETAINLNVAKALGLTVPPALVVIAHELIE